MNITARLFEAFLKCPTKCYLRSLGEVEAGNAYATWLQTQTESYHAAEVERLRCDTPPGDYVISPPVDDFKTAKWRLAVNAVAHSHGMESEIQALERLPAEGRGKTAQFVPIRFVPNNKLSMHDKLLLAFDALVLSTTIGREVAAGKSIHGDNHVAQRINTAALAGQVRKFVDHATALVSSKSPPELILNR